VTLLSACTGSGTSSGNATSTSTTTTTTSPDTSTTAPSSTEASDTTTTTVPRAPLADRAFLDLPSYGYAELAPDEVLLFAGGVEADASSDVIRAVDARAVGNPGEPAGVLVAYDLGPAFDDPDVWPRFAAGLAVGASTSPLHIDVSGTPATLIIDTAADTIGILWRPDQHLGLLAIADDGSEAFRIASEWVAAG